MWKYNNTDELYHHGVKGMKWGVRKKNLKRAIVKAQIDKSLNDDPNTAGQKKGVLYKIVTRFGSVQKNESTGKEYDKVVKKMMTDEDVKSIKKLQSELKKTQKQIDKFEDSSNPAQKDYFKKLEKMEDQERKNYYKVHDAITKLSKKYKNSFDNAVLSDAGYANIKKGKEMLRSYNLDKPLSEIQYIISDRVLD